MSSSYKKTVAYAPAITEKTQFAPLGKIDLTDTVNASASNIVVYGRSVAINQLIDFRLVRDYVDQTYPAHIISGIDIRAYDIDPVSQLSNCVVLNGTASADVEILLLSSETQFNRVPGHYYFLTGNNNSEASDSCYMVLGNEGDSDVLIDKGNPGDPGIHDGQIKAYEESGNVQSLYIKVLSGTTLNEVVFRPQLIDLTQLFGCDQSGSPYGALSYGEVRSLISSDYYSYNPGKIVGVESITIKSTADVGGETSSVQATISTVNGIGPYPISNISDINNGLFDVLNLKNKQHTKVVDSVNIGGDSFDEITIDIDTYFQSSSSATDAEDGSYCLSSDGTECIVQGGKFCFKASSNIYPSLSQWNEHVTKLSQAGCPLTVVYKKATSETVSIQNGLPTIKTYRGGTTVSIYTNDFSNPDAGYPYAGQDGGIAFSITYPLQESSSSNVSYKSKIYTTLGTPTTVSGNGTFVTNSAGVPAKDYTVRGKTIVWNQLLDKSKYPATTTTDGVTFTNNDDGTITVNGTASSDTNYYLIWPSDEFGIAGHKYFLCGCPSGGSYNTYRITSSITLNNVWKDGFSDDGTAGGNISRALSSGEVISISISIKSGYTANNLVFKPQLFDLTQMFGAGNEPATPAQFRAMFPDDYYPYNAGELKMIAPTSVEASTAERFQLLDKSKFTATTTIDGVTFTNNGDGTITYNGTASTEANYTLQSGLKVVAGHKYFSYVGENTNDKISVLLYADPDPYNTFDDRYPNADGGISMALKSPNMLYYQPKTINNVSYSNFVLKPQFFDLTEMFGAGNEPTTPAEFWQRVPEKLYGYNPSAYKFTNIPFSKYFPDGMRSAGSAYDEINFLSQKAIKRIGAVDMGTLNWVYDGDASYERFVANVDGIKITSGSAKGNLVCSKYTTTSVDDVYSHTADKTIAVHNINEQIWVYDTAYTDAAAFKAAMSGVMLYYELATPVETAITPSLQALSTYNGFTSFSAPNSLTQNGPLSVTYYAEGGTNPESGWLTSYKRKLYMGRNIEWNQLLDKGKFRATAELNGITAKNNGDGTFTLNGTYNLTDTTWINFYVDTEDVSLSKKLYGHKILYGCVQNPSAGSQSNEWGICYEINSNMSNGAFVLGNLGESSVIVTLNKVAASDITGNGFYFFFRAPSSGSAVYKDVVVRPQLFDLTQMFGAGNEPSTVEEFWSYFGNVVYPYNEGETQPLFKISRKSTTGSGV